MESSNLEKQQKWENSKSFEEFSHLIVSHQKTGEIQKEKRAIFSRSWVTFRRQVYSRAVIIGIETAIKVLQDTKVSPQKNTIDPSEIPVK